AGIWRWCALILPFCQRWICESTISMVSLLIPGRAYLKRPALPALLTCARQDGQIGPRRLLAYVAFGTKLRALEARRRHCVEKNSARVALEPRGAGPGRARPGRPGVLSVRGRLLLRLSLRHVLQPGRRVPVLV